MKQEEKNSRQAETSLNLSFVICAVATMAAGREIKTLEDFLKMEGFGKNYMAWRNIKLAKGAYNSWVESVFNFDKFRKTKCEDMHEVQKRCEEIAQRITSDVVIFKSSIASYMIEDDIICENTLSQMVTICSLLNLAVKICKYQQQEKETTETMRRTLEIAAPKQMFQNVRKVYDYLPVPDDFDVEGSEKVKAAMDVVCERICSLFVEYFAEKEEAK